MKTPSWLKFGPDQFTSSFPGELCYIPIQTYIPTPFHNAHQTFSATSSASCTSKLSIQALTLFYPRNEKDKQTYKAPKSPSNAYHTAYTHRTSPQRTTPTFPYITTHISPSPSTLPRIIQNETKRSRRHRPTPASGRQNYRPFQSRGDSTVHAGEQGG